jgi:ABC-2 type transport system permease protein
MVLANGAAVATAAVVISLLTGLGVAAGSPIGGMDLDMVGVAAVSAQMAGLGMFFGLVALALSAAFSSRVALGRTVGVALVAYLAQSILSLNDSAQKWSALSPWHYYSANDPLVNVFNLWYLVVLVGLSAIALTAAVVAFENRDSVA